MDSAPAASTRIDELGEKPALADPGFAGDEDD